jgi:hypothetical protein
MRSVNEVIFVAGHRGMGGSAIPHLTGRNFTPFFCLSHYVPGRITPCIA